MAKNELEARKQNHAQAFRQGVQRDAVAYLNEMLGSEEGKRAGAKVAMAFAAAARTARNPAALYNCNRASIVAAVAHSAMTGLMPGGPLANVWLVPKGTELQWWLSHRGMCTLAVRAGYQVIAVPVHVDDDFRVEFGEVVHHQADPEAWPAKLDDMAGVYVKIRRLSDGGDLGKPWLPLQAIKARKAKALTPNVWTSWPVEMAQKTAIRWAMARGYVPIEMELQQAVEGEPQHTGGMIDVTPPAHPEDDNGSAALGLPMVDDPPPPVAAEPPPTNDKPAAAADMPPDPPASAGGPPM